MVDENILQGGDGLLDAHRDGDSLACSQPIGLDHDRGTLVLNVLFRTFQILEGLVFGGRNAVPFHQAFGEILRSFDLCGRLVRSESLDPRIGETIDDTLHQRDLRPYEDPVDIVLPYEIDQSRVVGLCQLARVDAVTLHTGIAGGAIHVINAVSLEQGIRHRVLAGARTDDQNLLSHGVPLLVRSHAWIQMPWRSSTRAPLSLMIRPTT